MQIGRVWTFLLYAILFLFFIIHPLKSHAEEEIPYAREFRHVEESFGLPHRILVEIARKESNFGKALSECETAGITGDLGIMQLNPRYFDRATACNPRDAIWTAGKYLRHLYDRFGSWYLALVSYNWGETRLASGARIPRSVQTYAHHILERVQDHVI